MAAQLETLASVIKKSLGTDLEAWRIHHGELEITVDLTAIARVLTFLRDNKDMLFSQLMDVCGVDYLGREKRFEVVYNLLSLKYNTRIRVKLAAAEDASVPTVTSVFSSAGWWEREVFDLFGIDFQDHPDLRRILTDYGFEGHPLRKDFPLSGYVEVRYDDGQKKVIYEPVKLPQAYRNFDNASPWEGMSDVAASHFGDEKADKEAC